MGLFLANKFMSSTANGALKEVISLEQVRVMAETLEDSEEYSTSGNTDEDDWESPKTLAKENNVSMDIISVQEFQTVQN